MMTLRWISIISAVMLMPALARGQATAQGTAGQRSPTGEVGPSLQDVLTAAKRHSLIVAEPRAAATAVAANEAVATGALWPSLSVTGGLTRNQDEVAIAIPRGNEPPFEATIQPRYQWETSAQLNVPVFDLSARRRAKASVVATSASRASIGNAEMVAQRQAISAYYGWLGGSALLTAARSSLLSSQESLAVTERRAAAGLSVELETLKAKASVMRSKRAVASAQLVVTNAVRQLRSLTGLAIDDANPAPALAVSPAAEASLDKLTSNVQTQPESLAAKASTASAQASVDTQDAAWFPRLDAFVRERISNSGFVTSAQWAAGVQLSWNVDLSTAAAIKAAAAQRDLAKIREQVAAQNVKDRIIDLYNQMQNDAVIVSAAAAELEANSKALAITKLRVEQGTATTLQLLEAQDDVLDAQAAMIRAQADFAATQALLVLESGQGAP
jgi:outer membrane protein